MLPVYFSNKFVSNNNLISEIRLQIVIESYDFETHFLILYINLISLSVSNIIDGTLKKNRIL